MTETETPDWPDVVLTDEARADMCRALRMTPEQVDEFMAKANKNTRASFWAYRATNPDATPDEFSRALIANAHREAGLPAPRAWRK